ncbi:hypothetical protein [Pantoea agglomerans]|uniref:hypothetical protein n=1 Tax=Enterobacter agglomerans TaxID=549 RepID=UPI003C7A9371
MNSAMILTGLVYIAVLAGCVFIGKKWLESTVQSAVKHEYDVLLEQIKNANIQAHEDQKRQHEIRMKSALIAELMAEWVSYPLERKRLRQLTNEAFLWLPPDLADELSKVLSKKSDAINYRDFLGRVRKYLLGGDDVLESSKIITFDLTDYEINDISNKHEQASRLNIFNLSLAESKSLNKGSTGDEV